MKKLTTKSALLTIVTLGILAVSVSSLGGWGSGSNNQWNKKFIKDNAGDEKDKTTKNLETGQKYDKNGNPIGAPEPVTVEEKNYGAGGLNCREAVVKVVTVFDSPSSTGTSGIKVPELKHLEKRTYNCTDITPALTSSLGVPVTAGTITIQCGNGQLAVLASNCTAPTPPPTPTPTPPGGGGGTDPTPPAATPPPVATPPPGYPNSHCSSWCGATITCSQRTGKGGGSQSVSYRACQSGQYYYTGSGTCSNSKPANCN